MPVAISGFDWDQGNRQKCQMHGVSLAEIESVLLGEIHLFPDLEHSTQETRFIGIGKTPERRHVLVAFTHRVAGGMLLIRPISARFMHDREVKHFESQIQKP